MVTPTLILSITLFIAAGALIWASISDIRYYFIPNTIPIIITAAYAVFAFFMPLPHLIGGLLMGTLVFAAGALLFARGLMGGGDVKLMAAAALWAGPSLISTFAIAVSLSGALLAALMLSPLRGLMPAPSQDAVALTGGSDTGLRQPMPFGVAIAIGGLCVLALSIPTLS